MKVKIERASGFSFDEILNKVIECESKNSILQNISEKYKEIAERYFDNRDFFFKKLEDTFTENNLFTFKKAEEFDSFGEFLRTKISVVVINTINFETAYNIFEVLNNRGLPLSAKDLFRNFIISEFDKAKENDPDQKWNALEESYEVTSDFLGRFVESYTGSQAQKSAFNEIQDYYNKMTVIGKLKIFDFYARIDENLNYYTMIVNDQNIQDKCIRSKVQFIKLLEHERYSTNFLLTVFRYFKFDGKSNSQVLQFLTVYEKFRLYVLLSPYKRFTSSPIYKSIRELNEKNAQKAIKEIQDFTDEQELKHLIDGFIYDNYNAKLLISKFLFAEYCNKDDVVEHELNFKKSTLEHIIPQNPDKSTNWLTDFTGAFRKEWTYRLGNFTLLTHNMNSSAKNYDFSKKQKEYEKTILHITKELTMLKTIDEQNIRDRHTKIVNTIYMNLSLV